MRSQNKKKLITLFLILIFLALVPINMNGKPKAITSINSNQEFSDLQHRPNYVVVPITINKVKGTALTNEQVEASIKKMNEIYNSEVVIFIWDGKINEIADPDNNNDGKIGNTQDDRTKVRNQAALNADGKGVSITVCEDLGDANTNGITIVGSAHSALVKKGTDGETWAHELQHALGQSHGTSRPADEDINGAEPGNGVGWDVNGDGKVTNADKNYNLWGRKSDRTGNAINCNAIYGNASSLPGVSPKTRPISSCPSKYHNTTKTGVINDTRGDPTNQTGSVKPTATHVDIICGGIQKNYTDSSIKLWTQIASPPLDNCTYTFVFDNQANWGDNISEDLSGADIIIQFTVRSGNYTTAYSLWDNETGKWNEPVELPLESIFKMHPLNETISYSNATGSGEVNSFFDVFLWAEIHDYLLFSELEGTFNMWIIGDRWDSRHIEQLSDLTERYEIELKNQAIETITVNTDMVRATGLLTINGTHFTANSNITIYIDGANMTTTKTDGNGAFSANIIIPANLSSKNAILMARDEMGKSDAIYIEIQGLSPGISNLILVILIIAGVIIAFCVFMFFTKKYRHE